MKDITTLLFDVGGTLVDDNFLDVYWKTPKLREGVFEVLLLLKSKYNLYLATRYPVSSQEKILKHHGLEKIIKLIKEEPPFQKPDQRFFAWLLDKINIKPREAIMVGDSLEIDIIPAKSLGLKTIWFYQDNISLSALPPNAAPDWQVKTFKEIIKILF